MTGLVPMYRNSSFVLINPGYRPWIVIANQESGVLLAMYLWGALLGLHWFNNHGPDGGLREAPQKAPNGQPYTKNGTLHSLFSQENMFRGGALFSSFFHICKTCFQFYYFRYLSTHILMFNFG